MAEDFLLVLRALFTQPWWAYDPGRATSWDRLYRGFNFCEGCVWLAFSLLVLLRWRRHQRSRLEWAYAAAFLIFGLTDFREAAVQSAGLVLLKAVVLGVLWWLRRRVIQLYEGRFWW